MIIRRENKFKTNSFLDLYRPCLPDEIIGQETSKQIIKNGLDNQSLQHTLLFTGPAGCGKTTAARIVSLGLNCELSEGPTSNPCLQCKSCMEILNDSSIDVVEVNVGKEGGKAAVDHLIKNVNFAPMRLRHKVLIFDEAHQLTSSARDLLLKPMEDGFSHVYYIFCTNQPEKLRSADKQGGTPFIDRCSVLTFNPVSKEKIYTLLENICVFEGVDYETEILDILAEESNGVPRKGVNWLSQVFIEGSWSKDALRDIIGTIGDEDENVFNLCKLIYHDSFKNVVQEYEKVKEKTPVESIRIALAFYYLKLLKSGNQNFEKMGNIIEVLRTPIYESGKVADIAMIHNLYKIYRIVRG